MTQLTYITMDGEVIDLQTLTPPERRFLEKMVQLYSAAAPWGDFARLASGEQNPVLEPGCVVTRAVAAHPLYRVVDDMENRLAIQQGVLRPGAGHDPNTDPFADSYTGVYEAAEQLGVTHKAVYSAIERGDLVALRERPARVSKASLDRYRVSQRHVAAGRARSSS